MVETKRVIDAKIPQYRLVVRNALSYPGRTETIGVTMVIRTVRRTGTAIMIGGFSAMLVACAPASLGSPPPSERMERCRTGETLVCRTHDIGRIEKDDEREYDFCTCKALDRGLLY